MSGKQQGLRYFQKFLNSKASERNALAKKVLRYVMAVGFVLSPWLGGEAYAAGIERIDGLNHLPDGVQQKYLDGTDVADIYPDMVNGTTGFNKFKTFNVGENQTANLHFKTGPSGTTLDSLVNVVNTQINISGTVKAIYDSNSSGKLYFLSPAGMVVGPKGVINACSLTVIAQREDFFDGVNLKDFNPYWTFFYSNDGQITVNGKINASGGVDLRAAYVSISRIDSTNPSSTNTNNTIPSTTVTGANLFNEVVNLTGNEANEATVLKAVIDASGNISIKAVKELKFINAEINSSNGKVGLDAIGDNNGTLDLQGSSVTAEKELKIEVGNTIAIDSTSSVISRNDVINMHTEKSAINNYGTISAKNILNVTAGNSSSGSANLTNGGTIQSPDGTIKLVAKNNITNSGTIQAEGQIAFDVGDTLSNNGVINSTGSNVQAHIGRNFNNIGVPESPNSSTLKGGIIEASGNVQVDYTLPKGMSAVSASSSPVGIVNSGTIRANGNTAPGSKDDGTVNMETGSGNIWLTSSYNIENTATGQMIAGRQITLNARDFLHNYGLIEGVTYLDIKSIMGYVYNHDTGRIISTGGNIDLSSGQANLKIDNDTDGQKKENYRKFTPIIIEGLVRATSDDDDNNQTKKGDIKITAHLGDIYVVGGTIETKPEVNDDNKVVAEAGDVILDAAQKITIGFNIMSDTADDPTTDGENANKKDEKDYFLPNLQEPSGKNITIFGTNITLKSGSKENNWIIASAN